MVGLAGETAIDCSVGVVTVSSVDAGTLSKVALIVEVPAAMARTRPLLSESLLTVATAGSLESQSASKVRSWVVPSEKVPFAVNWLLTPLAIVGAAGVIVRPVIVAGLIVSVKVDET